MEVLRKDLYRYEGIRSKSLAVRLRYFFFVPGYTYIHFMRKCKYGSKILFPLRFLFLKITSYITHIQIPYSTSIGPGFRIVHFGAIVVNPNAIIGKNFNISQGCLIGNAQGKRAGTPVIGDNVCMNANSIIVGKCSLYDPMCRQMGEDEYFNMQLFPFIRSLYVTDDFVSVYRYGGMTNTYNKNLTSLFDFSDLRIRFLDRYHYDKGYFPLFIEYKNILNSELLQRIQYLEQDESTLITYLQEELSNRYLVQRMRSYFQSEVPSSLSPIIEASYEEIYLW